MRILLAGAAMCAALWPAAPSQAADTEAAPRAPVIRDSDVDLVFAYLREALRAAAEGREAPPSGALEQRGAEIAETLRRRGLEAGQGLLNEAERGAREALREWERPRREPAARPLPGQQAI
jgi:hypothetical protein